MSLVSGSLKIQFHEFGKWFSKDSVS
jgi:hypothetical protein